MPAGVSDAKTSKLKKDENRVKRRSLGPRGQSQSCHQCRQSIFSTNGTRDSLSGKDRVKCSICTRFWCEKCLENRYGIHKGKVGTNWKCPFCSGQCNCSVCRRKEGKLATGILSPLVRNAGFSSVSEFLDKGTDQVAKCLHWKTSSSMMSRESPLMSPKRPSGVDRSGYFAKSMRLSVEKLNPSMLKRGGPSPFPNAWHDVKRKRLNHTLYSISIEDDEDIGDTSDVKSEKRSEMTSSKLVKSTCPETTAGSTPENVVDSNKMADVLPEGNDQRSEKRVLSEEIRLSASPRDLTPPNTSCCPRGIGKKRKCDQLPMSTKGDGITQAQAHITVGTQAHIKVGKHKDLQDEEASVGASKKLRTMQVHAEDKTSVSTSGTVPLSAVDVVDPQDEEASVGASKKLRTMQVHAEDKTSVSTSGTVPLSAVDVVDPQDEEASVGASKKQCTMQVHAEDKTSVSTSGTVPLSAVDVVSSTFETKKSDVEEALHGMQLVKAKNVHAAITYSELGGPSKESHQPAHRNNEVPRPTECVVDKMAMALKGLTASKVGDCGKVKLKTLDRQKAKEKEKEEREKAKLKLKEERAILKMKAKEDRENAKIKMKEKMKEEREVFRQKLKEEKKLKKLEERALAQERKREERQKEKEEKDKRRQDMQRELKELKLQKKKELAEAIKLPSVGAGEEQEEASSLEDDSVQQCLECGMPDLPPLQPLDVGVSWGDVPRFLFVCEFLYTFGSVLKLRRAVSLSRLQALLPNGRGMNDVYQCLLQAVLDPANRVAGQSSPNHSTNQLSQPPKSHVTSQLLADKKQPQDVEKLVAEYLHASGRNGFIATDSGAPTVEQSLVMLEHLCTEALDSSIISDHIQSSVAKVEEMKRKKRLSLKEKIRDCSEELERLCEEGVSLEELKEKRDQFAEKLINLRRKLDCERLKNALVLRNPPLGTDRHNRVYWKLQCSEGLLVEVEPQTTESTSSQSSSEVTWAIIESRDEVKEFIECLHPRGRREGLLLEKIKDAVGLYDNYLVSKKPTPPQTTQ